MVDRFRPFLWRCAMLLGAAVLLGGTPAVAAPSENSGIASVVLVDTPSPPAAWSFSPSTLHVAPGTWVTWSNSGSEGHTVTAVDGSFDSGELTPSDGFSWYFSDPGSFPYVCTVHPWMSGTVVVDGPAPPDAASPLPVASDLSAESGAPSASASDGSVLVDPGGEYASTSS